MNTRYKTLNIEHWRTVATALVQIAEALLSSKKSIGIVLLRNFAVRLRGKLAVIRHWPGGLLS